MSSLVSLVGQPQLAPAVCAEARAIGVLPAPGQLASVEEIRKALTWKNSRQPALRQAFKQEGLDVADVLGCSAWISCVVLVLPAGVSAAVFGPVVLPFLGALAAFVFSLSAFKLARTSELDSMAREIFRSQLSGASGATLEQLKSSREFDGQRDTQLELRLMMQEAQRAARPSTADILAGRSPLLLEEGLVEGNQADPTSSALT